MALKVKASCPSGCDLRGGTVTVMGADAVVMTSALATYDEKIRVYPGFPIRLGALPGFVVGDLMWNALWKLVENEQRFPRRGGRVLCVHGAVSFHRARPCVRPVCRPGSTRAPLNRIVKIVTNRASRYRHRTTSLS